MPLMKRTCQRDLFRRARTQREDRATSFPESIGVDELHNYFRLHCGLSLALSIDAIVVSWSSFGDDIDRSTFQPMDISAETPQRWQQICPMLSICLLFLLSAPRCAHIQSEGRGGTGSSRHIHNKRRWTECYR